MKDRDISDLEDCNYKINAILKEYNCYIIFDEELKTTIIVDRDTNKFAHLERNEKISDLNLVEKG